jgi:hypothetical protein
LDGREGRGVDRDFYATRIARIRKGLPDRLVSTTCLMSTDLLNGFDGDVQLYYELDEADARAPDRKVA